MTDVGTLVLLPPGEDADDESVVAADFVVLSSLVSVLLLLLQSTVASAPDWMILSLEALLPDSTEDGCDWRFRFDIDC